MLSYVSVPLVRAPASAAYQGVNTRLSAAAAVALPDLRVPNSPPEVQLDVHGEQRP